MAESQIPLADINLALFGKVGIGKSRTGNTILNKVCFESRGAPFAVTKTTLVGEELQTDGRKIRVVDTPGICDPESNKSPLDEISDTMTSVLDKSDKGYHALLLLFKYGVMSKEDSDMAEQIPSYYGKCFVKNHCIILITFGDNYELDMQVTEEGGETVDKWFRQQGPVFKKLLDLCDGRILLINNATKDQDKKDKQRKRLIDMVIHFQLTNGLRLKQAPTTNQWQCTVM